MWRCCMQSAGHTTDGVIDAGTAVLIGGSRAQALIAAAVEVGLITRIDGSTPPSWQLVDDPAFIHIRSRESIAFDRQRDNDRKNTGLTMPVRLRDGDACRYCGVVVSNRDRTGTRSLTYDHTAPGQPATVDTYVVCCRGCNSRMKDGNRLELLPPPSEPFYHPWTVEQLVNHGLTPPSSRRVDLPATPSTQASPRTDDRRADPQAPGRTPQAQPRSGPPSWALAESPPGGPPGEIRQDPLAGQGGIPDGTGRDGPGRGGPGRAGAGGRRRRPRGRGGRRRGGSGGGDQ